MAGAAPPLLSLSPSPSPESGRFSWPGLKPGARHYQALAESPVPEWKDPSTWFCFLIWILSF